MSEVLYTVALLFYMQAMPLRLVALSVGANIVVLVLKLIWRGE